MIKPIQQRKTLKLDCKITRRLLTAILGLFHRLWRRRHLRAEALDNLQARAPVRLHLDLHGVALCMLEDRREPVREEAELAHEQGEVFRRYELKVPGGCELRHARRALYRHAEVLVFVLRLRASCGGGAGRGCGGGVVGEDVDENVVIAPRGE